MSPGNRQFSLAIESYLELKDEVDAPLLRQKSLDPTQGRLGSPTLRNILAEIGSLPREALFLGIASDGLPVLLNLHDPAPGPLLITGDQGSGKTDFLLSIAHSLIKTHRPTDLQYGVITSQPNEWSEIENTSHCVGIFSINDTSAQDLIVSMTSWAHQSKNVRQSVLLMVDDLEAITRQEFDALQNFRWLLARGTSRRVWPIIAMNAGRYGQVLSWIPIFRTRIFGCIKNEGVATALGGNKESELDQLEAPNQFSLRENDSWLRFKLPG